MKILSALITFLLVSAGLRAGEYEDSLKLRAQANAWTNGEPIPTKLLKFCESHEDGSCFPNLADTASIFYDITNYSLFKAIVFRRDTDLRIFTNAVNEALVIAGPTRFFQDTIETLRSNPDLLQVAKFKELRRQARVKHIVVDSLCITYADMPADKIKGVFAEIENELKKGAIWNEVYGKWSGKLEYSYEEKLSDGTAIKGTRTKLGKLGSFVIPKNKNKLFSDGEQWMPQSQLGKLFSAHQGDVLILFDEEDLSRFPDVAQKETGERYVLHRVREVWEGEK